MSRFTDTWQKKSVFEKVIATTMLLLSCCVIVLSTLGLADVFAIGTTNLIVQPMLGIIMLLNGFIQYKINKIVAVFVWFCSAFIFLCWILTVIV